MLEALLFASPQPLNAAALGEVLEPLTELELREVAARLKASLDAAGRGVALVEVAGGWQIVSRREYAHYVQKMLRGRRKARLSRAALETLAIVAYRQPVTKTDIENIRGVDSSGVLAHLLERNLVGIRGRAKAVGRPLLYGTTQEFLVYFGLNDLADLPKPEELAALLKERDLAADRDGFEDPDYPGEGAGAPAEAAPEPELFEDAGGPRSDDWHTRPGEAGEDLSAAVSSEGQPHGDPTR